MQDRPSGGPDVIALPPLILGAAIALGLILNYFWPAKVLAHSLAVPLGILNHLRCRRHRSLGCAGDGYGEHAPRCPQTFDPDRDLGNLPTKPQSDLSRHGSTLHRRRFSRRFALASGSCPAVRGYSTKRRDRTGRSLSRTQFRGRISALQSQGPALDIALDLKIVL